MMAMAKGLTAGYIPFGCLMVSDKISKYFDDKPLMIGLTYSAHAVGCAAALAVLGIYEKENYSRSYSFFRTFEADQDLQSVQEELNKDIINQLTEKIFNETFASW